MQSYRNNPEGEENQNASKQMDRELFALKMQDAALRQWDHDLRVAKAMQKYGGSFVKALAEAALRADADNLGRIKETWPEYWEKYEKMANTQPNEA